MINTKNFINQLQSYDINFYCGVPDSLLSPYSAMLENMVEESIPLQHHSCANEGSAIAMASGHHLASGKIACAYMQNSGMGNALNPLVSLAAKDAYAIPMLLVIGWRGEMQDGVQLKDEPQHVMQGRISEDLLKVLDIPYFILEKDMLDWENQLKCLLQRAISDSKPVAVLVRKNTFAPDAKVDIKPTEVTLSREQAIDCIINTIPEDMPVVATTGKTSRELYELRAARKGDNHQDFLCVGSMGHASQIAAGIALSRPSAPVLCLDGDGACLMHMGGLKATANIRNLKHIVLHNGVHDSVGGQKTVAGSDSLFPIAKACGYKWVKSVSNQGELEQSLQEFLQFGGSCFLEVVVKPGARNDLGRPKEKPDENKLAFMNFLSHLKITN